MNRCRVNPGCKWKHIETQRYVKRLGPVIMGVKPLHLFSFVNETAFFQDHVQQLKHALECCNKMDCIVVQCDNGNVKMLVYNKVSCEILITESQNRLFLERCGYPRKAKFEDYLKSFVKSLQNNKIPHEMGLFFGYPLKDVMGFMGMTRLKHTKTKGWKFFGDPVISEKKWLAFEEAEKSIDYFASGNPIEFLMSGAF